MHARGRLPVHGLPLGKTLVIVAEARVQALFRQFQIAGIRRHSIDEGRRGRLGAQFARRERCPIFVGQSVNTALDFLVPRVLRAQRALANLGPSVAVEEQPRMVTITRIPNSRREGITGFLLNQRLDFALIGGLASTRSAASPGPRWTSSSFSAAMFRGAWS